LGRRRRSPNWHRGAFRNVDHGRRRSRALGFLKWRLQERGRRHPRRLDRGAPHVEPDLGLLRQGGFEGITWLGHATVLIQLAGLNLLVDPLWGSPIGYPCRLAPQPMAIDQLPPIAAVLISHNHLDHLDMRTVRRLGRRPVYAVPLGVEGFLRRRFRNAVGLDWWETHPLDGLRLTFVPSHHWSQRGLTWNRTLWGGWVIESPRTTVYFSGDTARTPVLDEIGRRFPRIDYAILSAGSYKPRWYMRHMHMCPREAVDTFVSLGARTLIPVHWGTLRLGAEPPGEPPHLLRREAARRAVPPDALRILAIGETLPVAAASRPAP
jgi:L-ascorbate metabolism protein UlaG (beta-lactamase superfamily)